VTVPATSVTAGATGAVLGLYGLLAAVAVYGYLVRRDFRSPARAETARRRRSRLAISLLFAEGPGMAGDVAGLVTGLAAGIVLARGVTQQKPGVLRSAARHGRRDRTRGGRRTPAARYHRRAARDSRASRTVESTTTTEYAKALVGFTSGRSSAKALVQVIQSRILPALQADRARIDALHGVPVEQAPLVAAARRYFDLREASWRRRAEGLLGSNIKTLHDADQAERTALAALDELQRITTG